MRHWILLAILLAGGCLEPAVPGSLALQLRGPSNPRPRCAKGPAALGRLYPLGEPISGARVILTPGDFTGTTDAEGAFTIDLPDGRYRMTVEAAGFVAEESQIVEIAPGESTSLGLRLHPCIFGGGDRFDVGFDRKITLTAASMCEGWQDATYTWTQVEGPDIRGSVADWSRQQLTFSTRKLEEVRPLPDEAQILSFSPDEAGQYVFQVVGRSPGGAVSRSYVLVTSTSVAGPISAVPPYQTAYFIGEKGGPWDWKTLEPWPVGWSRMLDGQSSRVVSLKVLPPGQTSTQTTLSIIDVSLTSGTTFALEVGDWNNVNRDCGRSTCHPTLQRSWEGTRHASTWRKLLDGELVSARAPAAESCAHCHSLGYDRSKPNGGYDDVADLHGVTFPTELKRGNYQRLPDSVKDVSNIYCLACHGPGRLESPGAGTSGLFSAGVCARCHDRLPEQDLVAQWRTSLMAQTIKGDLNGAEARSECSVCHTGQGFYYDRFALGRPPNPNTVKAFNPDTLAPITCQICHSPMYANNKAQLFAFDGVSTDSGLVLQQVGSGAICIHCHNTGHDVSQAGTLAERLAPHSPQADLSYGQGGYLLGPASYPVPSGSACSLTAGDGCATCHMDEGPAPGDPDYRKVGDHTFHMVSSEGSPNSRPCQACHPGRQSFDPRARHDYDGNGKVQSVRLEVDGLMAELRARLSAAIAARGYAGCDAAGSKGVFIKRGFAHKIVVVDGLGFDLGDCDRNGVVERQEDPFVFPDADLLLHRAAYNYLFVKTDKSRGLHNLPYVVSLLQGTIHAISGGTNLPDWDLFRPAR